MTFEIRPRGGLHPHLPVPLLDGMQSTVDLELLMEPQGATTRHAHLFETGQPELGSYFLPPFQRPAVWTREQQARFVESALLGVNLGSLVVVDAANEPMQANGLFPAVDRWLLDGRQRLGALLAYRHDEVEPFAGTACAHRWSDLGEVERRKVLHVQIGLFRVRTSDPEYCREVYDRLNYGGTPHQERPAADADRLRAEGWTVAVHNDYRLAGEAHTFWLWTHPDGRYVKGEGRTDAEALAQCVIASGATGPA